MSNIVAFNPHSMILITDKQVELARQLNPDLTPTQFNHFVHMCREWLLDPLRKQIYAIAFKRKRKTGQKDANGKEVWEEYTQVTYVVGIDGYRTIADRSGTYRPGQRTFTYLDEKTPNNPQGIESATVTMEKFSQGEWHQFSETVFWEEFAPLKEVWAYDKELGKKAPTGIYELDTSGQWGKMGRIMLSKCAEVQCFRRGWPDTFAGMTSEEEKDVMMRDIIDITPSEQAEQAYTERLQERLGGPSIIVSYDPSEPLESVPVGVFHDAIEHWAKGATPEQVQSFRDRNVEALRQYYTHDQGAALDLKEILELASRNV